MYKNRYDVTLLINGLPLVQVELKRRGVELKEAFNQINRYQRHCYGYNSAFFSYVQLFVISNGVNTKYYANNKKQSFKQTFFRADRENNNITQLEAFTSIFLERSHISKMICKYIVPAEVPKILMVLRPYQYHAVEAIIDRVQNSNKNGYIWHTTGSGKTLTSFKAAQILFKLPHVRKVVFVVDRKDLDFQTTKEFNSFSEGSVDGTDNTKILVDQFLGRHKDKKGQSVQTDLIITTIQKLNTAISKKRYLTEMEPLRNEQIVFIFDECHRSQFGETHRNITRFFEKAQMIGFTGTPIFEENALGNKLGKRTTADLFGERPHRYVITDDNVLKFSVEYVGRYKEKEKERAKSRTETEKESVLKEVGFELELIRKDEINVSYILKLLAKYRKAKAEEQQKQRDTIISIINAQTGLRSKRELIEKFIDDHLMHIEDDDLIDDAFEKFWNEEQVKAFDELCEEENLNKAEVNKVIDTYLYDGRAPLKDDIANTLNVKPKLLERKKIVVISIIKASPLPSN